ncbi:MAG: hypothetical protein WEB57_08140 [Pseudohongiellaceae bacterium]
MANYARVRNNIAVDVSTNPESHFHPDIAGEFESVPDQVERRWRLVDGEWKAPEPSIPTDRDPKDTPAISPVDFMLLFTSQERVAIKAARENDQIVADFFDLLEDPRLDRVRLSQPAVQEGVQYLATQALITEARRDEILQGGAQ